MAGNRVFMQSERDLRLAVTDAPNDPAASGDPVLFGQLPGVALTDAGDTIANSGEATVQLDGVFDLAVSGRSDDGTAAVDQAITAGDIVYYDAADGQVNVDSNNGVRFGYALADVAAGATTTVRVQVGY